MKHSDCKIRELLGLQGIRTTLVYTQVLNMGGKGVKSSIDSV